MNSLLPISASPFEHNVAQACAGIDDIPVPLRDLWNPDTCPVRLLPYLAWARSVDRWDESWPEATKRQVVRDAFLVHQHKGTVAAVRRVIQTFNYLMEIKEWWLNNEPPGTFRLVIDVLSVGMDEAMREEMERLIFDAKPRSRHLTGLSIRTTTTGITHIGACLYDGDELTIYPNYVDKMTAGGGATSGAAIFIMDTTRVMS
ncbi:TPA: phage tail protein I [Serratia fonticola]